MADLEDVTLDGRPLQSLRVADLKAALEERGLSKSGQKNALIKRLKGALMLENLQRTSTAHIGLQPNSQIGEEMSQNSFIKQYLAKQQELLRQRLEREAREAYDTNEQEEHAEVNNSTSCPPPAQDATPVLTEQHKPPGPSGAANEGQGSRNQDTDMSSPLASASVAMRVPGGEHRPERGSASSEVAGDSDDEDSDDADEDCDDDEWDSGARRRNLREPARVPTVRERSGVPCPPQQQHIPSLLSPQLRQPTPPPSPPPELSFPLPDTPKQSPPSPDVAQARRSPSTSSSGSSSSGSRSSSPEPQRSGHAERKPGPLSLLVRKMESEGAFSGAGWHGADGEGDRQDSSSPSATSVPGRGTPEVLVSAITHTANAAGHVPFPVIPGTNQGVAGAHSAHVQVPVSVLKAAAAEERERARQAEIERERVAELERQEKLRKLEQERAMEEERERALALEREERERALEIERFARQQALEREKTLQRERELALERERKEREEREQALARERALELERQKEIERQRALEQERLQREKEERERCEREEMERKMELERAKALERERLEREKALEQERLARERVLEAERKEKERIERERALEAERKEKERIEREKALEAERQEKERIEREKAQEAERKEKERIEREKALEQERLERERIEREKAIEQERLKREKALELERIAREKALEEERIEREKALERERLERERVLEQERVEKEKAIEREKIEREMALEQERIEREKALEQERLKREKALELERLEKERALEQERLEREKALERERMEKERVERERALELEREQAMHREREEKEKAEREAALERERVEKERREREKALEQEKLEKEKILLQKEKEVQDKERDRLAEKERESHLPPSKRGREIGLTPLPTPPPPLLSTGPATKSWTEAGEQEGVRAAVSRGEAQAVESGGPMSPTPLSPQSSIKKFRFFRDSPLQTQPSSTSMVIKRPRTFSDSPQPRASPAIAVEQQLGQFPSTEEKDLDKQMSMEVVAKPPGSADLSEKESVESHKKDGATRLVSEENRHSALVKAEQAAGESTGKSRELDEKKGSPDQRGRDTKKKEKQRRRRSSSNDSSSSESDSGSSSSRSSGSSSSSEEDSRSTSRGRREEKPERDSSPLHRVKAQSGDLKETPKTTTCKRKTPEEKNNKIAEGDSDTKKSFIEAPTRGEMQRKRHTSEGEEEKDKQRQMKETAMADSEKLPETSEEMPKAFAARKISLTSSKSSPGSGSAEGELDAGTAAGRKRRWGSSTAVTAKKPSISITTDSLKSLIPDIRPSLGQEAVVDLHPEEAILSGAEDEDQERPDQDLQIRRTVTQIVHSESQENGQKETKRSRLDEMEELDEDDLRGERERSKPHEEQMDTSISGAVESQSPTLTSHDVETNTVTPSNTLIRRSISQQKTGVSITIDDPVRTARQPSPPRGKVSAIVHICNLVRPFTLGQLKELLSRTGTLLEDGFWIDKIKSHCYVTYSNVEEAIATRAALHGVKWPQSNPKVLSVDFCLQEELDFHKGLGTADRPGGDDQGPVRGRTSGLPSLLPERDQWAEREREMERRERARAEREWDRDKVREFGKPGEDKEGGPRRSRSREKRRKERGKSKEKKADKKDKAAEDPPAKLLDDLFRKTKAAPCIYWLPLTEEQFVQREAARAERKVEREKRRKEQEEEEKREEERKERMKAAGGATGDRSEAEKDKDRDRDRDRDRGRDRDRERDREREREREKERERENDKRRDGYRRPGGGGAGGGRRSRSRSEPRERRR